jgi:hypothetical protein
MPQTESEPIFSSVIVDDDVSAGRVRPAQPRAIGFNPWWFAVIVLAVAVTASVYWWRLEQAPSAPLSPVTEASPAKGEAPPAKAEPAIRHPIDDTRSRVGLMDSGEDRKRLPPVSESDAIVRETLSSVSGGSAFERYFYPQDIVRRFVATVDNLPRKSVAPKVTVVKPLSGSFLAAGTEGNLSISGDNAARYTPYVQFARAVDTKALVALYVRFYPWFQQAYQDLGYPSGYFNDRLIDVIDNLLAAPVTSTPVALVQPHVLFEFADPDLEALSAGQKIMVRMGGENASQIGIKLRELRRMLTGAISPP